VQCCQDANEGMGVTTLEVINVIIYWDQNTTNHFATASSHSKDLLENLKDHLAYKHIHAIKASTSEAKLKGCQKNA